MEKIGIIAAMAQERNACLRFIERPERGKLGPFRSDRFQLFKRDCWLVTSGMGIQRAARAAHALVDAIYPRLLISVGVAGAVNANLKIGDVVTSRNTCLLEQVLPDTFQPLALLSSSAWQAARQALQIRQVSLFSGTAVTTRGNQFIKQLPAALENPILEMETTGIAQVAAEAGIPLLSLRGISDGPAAPIPFDLDMIVDAEANLRFGKIIKVVLRHPRLFPQLLRMGRNSAKAAENAAIALIAVLSQPLPVIPP